MSIDNIIRLRDLNGKKSGWEPGPDEQIIQSSAAFTASYVPPDYLIDKFLQRRYVYSLTGATGTGKTTIGLLLLAHVALGKPLGDREVDKGRCLMFVGENPDDVCARWIAMAQQMDFELNKIDVHFIPKRFSISDLIDRIREETERLGGIDLLLIDTSAAYFEGDNENDNVQLMQHAAMLQELKIPGGPCVIINCHPVKNFNDDNLVPRGAGAFLAAVDGNLCLKKDDSTLELHWQGKFRGPEFAPMYFMLRQVTHERLKDSKGRLIPTVVADPLTEQGKDEVTKTARSDENRLLAAVEEDSKISLSDLAAKLTWLLHDKPYKSKVQRVVARLKKGKYLTHERGEFDLTDKGKKALKKSEKHEK